MYFYMILWPLFWIQFQAVYQSLSLHILVFVCSFGGVILSSVFLLLVFLHLFSGIVETLCFRLWCLLSLNLPLYLRGVSTASVDTQRFMLPGAREFLPVPKGGMRVQGDTQAGHGVSPILLAVRRVWSGMLAKSQYHLLSSKVINAWVSPQWLPPLPTADSWITQRVC